jgi:uncharacterized membrane protein YhaH (DUF805 family)
MATDSGQAYIQLMDNKNVSMVDAVKDGFNRYTDFSGISTRAQYWYFVLATFLATLVASMIAGDTVGNLVSLATFLPTLAVAVRRMHDVGKSGWFILVPIYNFVLHVKPSKPGLPS